VFGEVIEGLEVIDKIAAVSTDPRDRPLENVTMQMELLKPQKWGKLQKQMDS
jgi:peptidyl-prolyl cis-trans isomerase B (cyclophilin B)